MKDNQTITRTMPDNIPTGNYIIMLIMSVVFAFQFLGDPKQIYLADMILKNASPKALLGYFWLHTGPLHIISNMILLAIFGRQACIKIGHAKYILIYFLLGLAAAYAHILLDGRPVIGASGAISGVMGLAIVLSWQKLSPLAPWLILIWLTTSIAAAVAANTPNAHIAHIAGFIAGMIAATTLIIINKADKKDTCNSIIKLQPQPA